MNRQEKASVEERIAAIAARQQGVVTRTQLREAGLSSTMVDGRVQSRQLRVLHRGIYLHGALVGRLEPAWVREMAAVLACGQGAVVSHESAASMWRLVPGKLDRAAVHVTIPGADRGRRPGIRPHRVDVLPAEDATAVDGVPATNAARTIVDLAGRVPRRTLARAVEEAERRDLIDADGIVTALERRGNGMGTALLRALIAGRGHPAFTRSTAEGKFLALVRQGGLPTPQTNVRVGESEVDFLWQAERVVVEVDGFAYHASRWRFENDRHRDARLAALGFQVVRVTWRQLATEPCAVLVRLAQTLARAGAAARSPKRIPVAAPHRED